MPVRFNLSFRTVPLEQLDLDHNYYQDKCEDLEKTVSHLRDMNSQQRNTIHRLQAAADVKEKFSAK